MPSPRVEQPSAAGVLPAGVLPANASREAAERRPAPGERVEVQEVGQRVGVGAAVGERRHLALVLESLLGPAR